MIFLYFPHRNSEYSIKSDKGTKCQDALIADSRLSVDFSVARIRSCNSNICQGIIVIIMSPAQLKKGLATISPKVVGVVSIISGIQNDTASKRKL